MAIVETTDLCKVYNPGRENSVTALRSVSLRIEPGEFVAIMGPSGSGKSTLLHLLGCLDTPSSGQVAIDGQVIGSTSRSALPGIRNQKIGFVFQQHHLIPTLDAVENVMLPLKYARVPRPEARARAHELLREVGLADRAKHRPLEMSGGQQQRVAIARALVCGPALVLADEPTGALDTATGDQIVTLMLELNSSRKVTFAVVTHNPEVARICRRTVLLRDGAVQSDTAAIGA